jgi:hypothetical protein
MPPSIIDQIREQQAWEQPKKSSSVGFIVGTIAAFGAGIIGVVAWGALPTLSISGLTAATRQAAAPAPAAAPAKQPDISIPTGGRMGTARESKLLNACIKADTSTLDLKIQKKDIYDMMRAGSQMRHDPADGGGVAFMWAELADCVYRQNGWALCDPDNRALAIETVSMMTKFVNADAGAKPAAGKETSGASGPFFTTRTFADVTAEVQGRPRPTQQQKLQSARAIKDRVLATLKTRTQEGRFIASDFGFFTPAEVTQLVKSVKPTSDACANKS